MYGIVTLYDSAFQPNYPQSTAGNAPLDYNSYSAVRQHDFQVELLPLHSQLLGESLLVSFPPLINMLKSSGSSYLISGPIVRTLRARLSFLRRQRGGGLGHAWHLADTQVCRMVSSAASVHKGLQEASTAAGNRTQQLGTYCLGACVARRCRRPPTTPGTHPAPVAELALHHGVSRTDGILPAVAHPHVTTSSHQLSSSRKAHAPNTGGCLRGVTDTETSMLPVNPEAQCAFKDLMAHGVLQFALRIAFRCVLHRCNSQDIHC